MKKIFLYFFVTAVFAIQVNAQVNWEKYASNPVFQRGTGGTWDDEYVMGPSIVYDGSYYHMWYEGYDGGNGARTGYAYSTNGIEWTRYPNPIVPLGVPGSWDALTVFQPCVLIDNDTTFKMWFCGHNGIATRQIGYATSYDSINWIKNDAINPILGPGPSGSWDDQWLDSPEVIHINGVYHMWYAGSNGIHTQIGHATSPDGLIWEKDTLNPVLKVGEAGSWDDVTVGGPTILFDGNNYHMWYSGGKQLAYDWKVGYAYSSDGLNWNKYSVDSPVLNIGSAGNWDDKHIGAGGVAVLFNENKDSLYMWFAGGRQTSSGNIGYATSPKAPFDFENNPLTKYQNNPVLQRESSGEWNSVLVENPYVLFDSTVYHMWYAGSDGSNGLKIGYAHSSDGIYWAKYNDPTTATSPYAESDPVLSTGPSGSWDEFHVLQPSVIFNGTSYQMWFGGIGDISFTDRNIGYATSPDTINWTEYNANPIVEPGPPGSWDDVWVDSPNVLFINGVYHMWYCGFDGTYVQTGHATSLDGITWDKDTLNPVLRVGPPGSWDGFWTYQPSVLFDGSGYHMFYSGSSVSGAFQWRTGYAYSFNGSNWIKYDDPTTTTTSYAESDPVLSTGPSGSWDDTYVGQSSVIFNNNSSGSITGFKMWYGGGNGTGTGDIGFASTDTSDFTPVGVEDNKLNVIPTEFSISQNYPNPFNPSTSIKYQIPVEGIVTLKIFNILGEEVNALINKEKPAGVYELTWNAENLPSGVYFYQLQAGNFVETKKMILLR